MALFDFTPNTLAPFQFQPTLDGRTYICFVTWNFAAQRWYVDLYDTEGAVIFSIALIGSPTGVPIQALSWEHGRVTATTLIPHGYKFASTIELTVSGCQPAGYDGKVMALITGPSTFTYPLTADPGPETSLGVVNYNINMAGGYFDSVLLYRTANRQFETIP